MLSWLLVIIASYLFFSLAYFGDKLVLSGPPNAKLYTFYVGSLNILVVFFIPFANFGLPNLMGFVWALAIQPLLILLLTWIFWQGQILTGNNLLAFTLLFLGSLLISVQKKFQISRHYLLLIFFASLMFSLDYIFSKLVFFHQPFLQGLIWMRIFSFLCVQVLLFDKTLRSQLFTKKPTLNKKTRIIFLCTQSAGGLAAILQSLAISLAPLAYLATVNSLRGIQYVFLFLITLFFSHFFPKVFKEEISEKVIIQKIAAIVLIVVGLAVLVAN